MSATPKLLRSPALIVACVALLVTLGAAGSASAAVSCTYSSAAHKVTVTLSANGDIVGLSRSAGSPAVINTNVGSCGGATVLNTDSVEIVDTSGGSTTAAVGLFEGQLAPGLTPEPGTSSEIELNVDLGSGFDFFEARSADAGSDVVFGAGGVNLNADQERVAGSGADADLTLSGVDSYEAIGGDGSDSFSGAGGTGTGAPFQARFVAAGFGGADLLTGGDGADILAGMDGDDEIRGGNGTDFLFGRTGDDTLDGQAGRDRAFYDRSPGAVQVSLATSGAQATGEGADTLIGVEDLTGSGFDDTLTGDGGPNSIDGGEGDDTLSGADGDDTLQGLAGSDTLNGDTGSDTAAYEGSPSAVTVDLSQSARQDTGGAGADALSGIENLAGTFFDDHLTGDGGTNRLAGNHGADTLVGGDGADRLEGSFGDDHLRSDDAVEDKDLCGEGNDDVTRDGLDFLEACETLLDPPAPGASEPSGSTPSSGSGSSASAPPTLSLLRPRPSPFRAARKGASIAKRGGARVGYTVSTAATTSFRVQRAAAGHRQGGRCVRPTDSNRTARPCTRWVRVRGSFAHHGAVGLNRFRFSGRVGRRKLKPGAYRLVAVARDASGASSAPARARFRIRR
jgi:Ca2+-binding RTX toxin-like protein